MTSNVKLVSPSRKRNNKKEVKKMLPKQITDRARFLKVVADAITAAELKSKSENEKLRWIKAIAKAVAHIEQNGEFMDYDTKENHLIIWSQESDKIYSANGVCQCTAYTDGIKYRRVAYPCFHRAAARLIRNYLGMAENTSPSFPHEPQAVLPVTSPSAAAYETVEAFVSGPAMGGKVHRVEKARIGGMCIQL